MNKMEITEFQNRIEAVARARNIFINSGLTNNITDAFTLYQEVLAEQHRDIFLSSAIHGDRPWTIFDEYDRPECPDCGADMLFRGVGENKEGIQIQLVCSNPKCDLVLSSKKTIVEWEKEMRKKNED